MNLIIFYGSSLTPLVKHGGVFRLATELRSHGYTVQCIDICAFIVAKQMHNLCEIIKKFIDSNTYWVGFSTTFFEHADKEHLDQFIAQLKINWPTLRIISGGSRNMDLKGVDHMFRNYTDLEIIEFTDICSKKTKKKNLKYLGSRIDGSEYANFPSSQISYVSQDLVHAQESLPIEISRGCIFNCKFCFFPLRGKRPGEGIKLAETLVEEFTRNYEQWGIRSYSYLDDTHNDSLEKLIYLDKYVYKKLKFQLEFTAYLRLDLIMRFPEMTTLLTQSGLKSALFGIETLNAKSAKVIGKGKDPKKQIEFLQNLKMKEFKEVLISSGFIYGLPYDTHDDYQKLEDFLFSEDNPLDGWFPNALGITPLHLRNDKTYFSEFDKNYSKYGYNLTDQGWVNKVTGLTYQHCRTQIDRLVEKSRLHPRYKFSGFGANVVKRFGVTSEDCLKLSRQENIVKYNLNHAIKKECIEYCNAIRQL